jgi:AcrR family transcriptional regulator
VSGAASARTFTVPRADGRLRRDATEQRILDATNDLLDNGASLAGLSVNRIVDHAGVSRATFYLHFSDKRGLIARLAEKELQTFSKMTDPFLEDPGAGRPEMAQLIGGLTELWRDHAGVLSSLIELSEYDAEARETWQATVQAIATRLAGALRQRRPELSAQQAATLAEIIAWTGERTCHQMIGRDSTKRQAARVAEGLTEAVWRIIAPAD